MSNVWDEVPDWGGVGALRLERRGRLGASVWELQPGARQIVYHFHHGSEELLVVLRGSPTVRMRDGDHSLREGDVVSFPVGPEGAHQIRNDGDDVVRVLIVSTNSSPDVAEYPDESRLGVLLEGRNWQTFDYTDRSDRGAGPT